MGSGRQVYLSESHGTLEHLPSLSQDTPSAMVAGILLRVFTTATEKRKRRQRGLFRVTYHAIAALTPQLVKQVLSLDLLSPGATDRPMFLLPDSSRQGPAARAGAMRCDGPCS